MCVCEFLTVYCLRRMTLLKLNLTGIREATEIVDLAALVAIEGAEVAALTEEAEAVEVLVEVVLEGIEVLAEIEAVEAQG